MHACFFQELFYDTFHDKEISAAVHTKRELHTLIRKLGKRQCFRQINVCQFIETNVFVSVAVVIAKRREHTI